MEKQNPLPSGVAEDWEALREQWRRGRASAPTRRDLAAALPQRAEALTDDAGAVLPERAALSWRAGDAGDAVAES
ncbi:MAG: hypothetical protein HOP19_15470 [Acidobacteria bacterium]|nr:hypothetical protein [Acidobacteriota bacterium]